MRGREKAADATESSQERERGIAEMALKPQKRPEWHGGNIKGGTQSYRAAQRGGEARRLFCLQNAAVVHRWWHKRERGRKWAAAAAARRVKMEK